ncbi:sensor histidine kinase [Collinsella sp. An307]|uniref:sensor histidine kinase n=1 Tax=Collinsella sp. An307 TaxID=1965630 RepID=UPI000B372D68|nr:sensor histidine kinase [Collinsella sp. An307]OUO19275.1 histidine kinase [Collinsella sp. An307]
MTARAYLRDTVVSWAPLVAVDALAAFILTVAGVNPYITALVTLLVFAGIVAAFALSFMRKRAFFGDLARATAGDAEPRWVAETVARPDFLEGELVYDVVHAIAKAASDDEAACRRQLMEYREYIETWVHEAKSPLAAAHLMLENLEERAGDTLGYERIEAVGDELRRVEGFIDQALFYARSEAVERDYLIRKYRLTSLVNAAIKANAPSLIAAHVAPVVDGLDLEVFTDEKWCAFILGQIIQNSVKYADAEQPTISFSARLVDEGLATEAVELTVADNGCGVSEADLPRVFEKGFTGENGRTGKRSTGIGLYLVKRLCDKMGVGISASSVQGEGFTVTLRFSTNKFQYFE